MSSVFIAENACAEGLTVLNLGTGGIHKKITIILSAYEDFPFQGLPPLAML